MARQLTQTLIKLNHNHLEPIQTLFTNQFSHKAAAAATVGQLIDVELEPSPPLNQTDVVPGIHQLEDAIHRIVVRRLQPDWLPFRPGSSYWAPPRQAVGDNLVQLVGKLANPLTQEESLSLVSANGWPSSSFFFDQGSLPVIGPPPVAEVHVFSQKSESSQLSEDDE